MSEGYDGHKNFFQILKSKLSRKKSVIVEHVPNNSIAGDIQIALMYRVSSYIAKLATYAGFHYTNECDIKQYISILSEQDMLQYGESITTEIEQTSDYTFSFLEHSDENNTPQIYCLIRSASDSSIYGVLQITSLTNEYGIVKAFLANNARYEEMPNDVSHMFGHIAFKHLCGFILNYTRTSIIRFPLLESDDLAYIVIEYPNDCITVEINNWLSEGKQCY